MERRKELLKNDALKDTIHGMLEDKTGKKRSEMVDLLCGAKLLIPVKITPKANMDKSGRYITTPKHKVSFSTVRKVPGMKPEDAFLLAFSDTEEYKKWCDGRQVDAFTGDINDFAIMLLSPGANCQGFILNPAGDRVVLTKQAVADIIKRRDAKEAASEAQ